MHQSLRQQLRKELLDVVQKYVGWMSLEEFVDLSVQVSRSVEVLEKNAADK